MVLYFIPSSRYNKAMEYFSAGNYEEAIERFKDLDFKDSKQMLATARKSKIQEEKRKEDEQKQIENDKKYTEYMQKAKAAFDQWQYENMLNTIEEVNGSGFESHYPETDKLLVEYLKKALMNDNYALVDKALSMIHDSSIPKNDKDYQDILTSYNAYVSIIRMGAIDTKAEIKETEKMLSKIKKDIKGVKDLKKLFKRYKKYLGFYKSTKKTYTMGIGKHWNYFNIALHMNKEETQWGVFNYGDLHNISESDVGPEPKLSILQHQFRYPKLRDDEECLVLVNKNTLYEYIAKKRIVYKRIKK